MLFQTQDGLDLRINCSFTVFLGLVGLMGSWARLAGSLLALPYACLLLEKDTFSISLRLSSPVFAVLSTASGESRDFSSVLFY